MTNRIFPSSFTFNLAWLSVAAVAVIKIQSAPFIHLPSKVLLLKGRQHLITGCSQWTVHFKNAQQLPKLSDFSDANFGFHYTPILILTFFFSFPGRLKKKKKMWHLKSLVNQSEKIQKMTEYTFSINTSLSLVVYDSSYSKWPAVCCNWARRPMNSDPKKNWATSLKPK